MKNLSIIFRRELGAYFNSAIAYIFMIVFIAFANGIFMMQFFQMGKADMRPFFSSLPYILNIFIPAVAMRLWAEDRRGNTYELLLTFPMKPHELVLGKYLASLTFTFFALAATGTVPVMIGWLGKIDMGAMLGGYLGVFLMAALFLAIGIFISNLCKDQIVAFVLTMIAAFALFMAGTDLMAVTLDGWAPGVGTFLKNHLGLGRRIIDLGKGVVDLKDIVYFIVMIAVFLFLNGLSLEGRYRPKARLFFSGAVGILLTSAVLVNWLIKDVPMGRFDMTEGKQYTVAPASVKILKELKVPVQVKLFISPADKMPTVLKSLEQDALGKLEELRVASGNKLRYQVVHVDAVPDEKDPMRQTLQNQGVVPFQVESVQKDEVGVKLIYSTLVLQYKEKPTEVIPRVVPQTLFDIEYQLLLRVHKMTLEDRPKVAIFAPAKKEELSPDVAKALGEEAKTARTEYADDYKTAAVLLRNNGYEVSRIALTKDDTIPEKTNMLLVLNPGSLTARQRFEINRYLRGGGTVVLAAQGFEYSFARQGKGLEAVPRKLSLDVNALTEKWGVKVNPDVLMDKNSQVISISTGQRVGPFSLEMPVNYPNQINVPDSSLNASSSLVNRISSLAYLWGSALDLSESAFKEQGLKSTVLFTSGRDSWKMPNDGATNLTEENTKPPAAATGGKYPLAVFLEGQFRDAFEGLAVPAWKDGEAAEEIKAVTPKPGRLLVIGCSQIFGENLIQNPGNINLFANIVDGFMLGDDLVKIRAKSGVVRDIRPVSAAEKLWFKFFTVALVPLLLFAAALGRIFLRKKEKEFYLAAITAKTD